MGVLAAHVFARREAEDAGETVVAVQQGAVYLRAKNAGKIALDQFAVSFLRLANGVRGLFPVGHVPEIHDDRPDRIFTPLVAERGLHAAACPAAVVDAKDAEHDLPGMLQTAGKRLATQ